MPIDDTQSDDGQTPEGLGDPAAQTPAGAPISTRVMTIGLFVGVLLVYLPSLRNGFVYDDYSMILHQPEPASLWEVGPVVKEMASGLPYYRPVTWSTFLIQKWLHGDSPAAFHFVNAVLMAATACVAFVLLQTPVFRINGGCAFWAAVLFAVHPASSACVYPAASGREALLAAFLMLASTCAFLRAGVACYITALLAALFAREQAIVLPALFVVADFLKLSPDAPGRDIRKWVTRYAPVTLVVVGWFAARWMLFSGSEFQLTAISSPTTPLYSLAFALQSIFAPFSALHYEPALDDWFSWPRLLLASVGVLILLAAFIRSQRDTPVANAPGTAAERRQRKALDASPGETETTLAKAPEGRQESQEPGSPPPLQGFLFRSDILRGFAPRAIRCHPSGTNETSPIRNIDAEPGIRRVAFFWLAWFLLMFLPTANILKQETQFDERYVLLSLLSVMALVATLVCQVSTGDSQAACVWLGHRNRRWARICLVTLCVCMTVYRAGFYENNLTFYTSWTNSSPRSALARHNLASALHARGRTVEAIDSFQQAVILDPNFTASHFDLAQTAAESGLPVLADQHYRKVIELEPAHGKAHMYLGNILFQQENFTGSIQHLRESVRHLPDSAIAHNSLGVALRQQNQLAEARRHLKTAITLDPESADAWFNLAEVLTDMDRPNEATHAFQQALGMLHPDSWKALHIQQRLHGESGTYNQQ